jgi:hypothetical protein
MAVDREKNSLAAPLLAVGGAPFGRTIGCRLPFTAPTEKSHRAPMGGVVSRGGIRLTSIGFFRRRVRAKNALDKR